MPEHRVPIGEVVQRTGLAASKLRYYEQLGILPAAERSGLRRIYGPEVFERLASIDLFVAAGFTLAEVKDLLHPAAGQPSLREQARAKLPDVQRKVAHASLAAKTLQHMIDCTAEPIDVCPSFHRLLSAHTEGFASGKGKPTVPDSATSAGLVD